MTKERFKKEEIKKDEFPFSKYIGDYVIISSVNGGSELGKLIGITNGYALLSPYVGSDYESGEGLVKKIFDDTITVNLAPNFSLHPTTRKNLEAYCKFQKEENEKERNIIEAEGKTKLSENNKNE